MNVYDFDETIFTGDSEDRFFTFMFAKKGFRHYKINFKFFDLLHKMHIITKTRSREHQYAFLTSIFLSLNHPFCLEKEISNDMCQK